MNRLSFKNWYKTTSSLRISLLVIAFFVRIILYILIPPYYISKEALLYPFTILVASDIAGLLADSIIIVECIRFIAYRLTVSWSLKKHFFVIFVFIIFLSMINVFFILPKKSAHYYNYGWSLAKKKEYQQAIRSLDISIHYNPRQFRAYLERAYVYRQLGNYSLALADCNKAIDIESNYARAYTSRGQTYYYLGEYAKALSDFEKVISLDKKESEALDKWIEAVKEKL